MNKTELPRGLTSILLIVAAWTGGYLHAQATSESAPPPKGPYRSVQPVPSVPGDTPIAVQQNMEQRQNQWQAQQKAMKKRQEEKILSLGIGYAFTRQEKESLRTPK